MVPWELNLAISGYYQSLEREYDFFAKLITGKGLKINSPKTIAFDARAVFEKMYYNR